MSEMYPPTTADYAQAAADRANQRLDEREPNLRDMFAAQALTSLASVMDIRRVDAVAVQAYAIADAMMAERKKNAG